MEEEVGIKVTRLRRRLSIESEDVKSPATQSTPTKKRGGRLATKPQLELIDENATEVEKPKRTKKTTVKEVAEEKAITPSRRSARIQSNTSILSESTVEVEDKGTPAKRNARIRSNTSIVADAVQYSDSPRAKRAARRTSQVGSDNEAPVTPARQTRKTRKDSTSSIDKQELNVPKLQNQVEEIIVEETENKTANIKDTSIRKSPRLQKKTDKKSPSSDNDNKENEIQIDKDSKNEENPVSVHVNKLTTENIQTDENIETNKLSVSSSKLIENLESDPKGKNQNLNKTAPHLEQGDTKSKRQRTKSWTTISSSPAVDNNFLSDSEVNKRNSNHNISSGFGSGDSILNTSNKSVQEKDIINETLNISSKSRKKKNKDKTLDSSSIQVEDGIILKTNHDKSANNMKDSLIINIEDDVKSSSKHDVNFTEKFIGAAPSGPVQTLVYFDDSDSNNGSGEKVNEIKELNNEDQCVPVVKHQFEDENSKEGHNNLSYEPMDVDVTIPENTSIAAFTEVNEASLNKSHRKSQLYNKSLNSEIQIENNLDKSKRNSLTISDDVDPSNKSLNKSKRKSVTQSKNQSLVEDNINKSLNKSKSLSLNKSNTRAALNNSSNDLSKNQSIVEDEINNVKDNVVDNNVLDHNKDKSNTSIKKSKRKSSANIDYQSNANKTPQSNKNSTLDTENKVNISVKELSISNYDEGGKTNNLTISNLDISKDNKTSNASSTLQSDVKKLSSSDNVDGADEVDCNSSKNQNKSSSQDVSLTSSNSTKKKTRNSSTLSAFSVDNTNNSLDKPSRKSLNATNNESISNKSKRKLSTSNDSVENMNKSNNENKSTLVLSQLKDMSESNVPKDCEFNDSNDQLSKSVNVPNTNKNKSDKKNISLTYSTSTPLQQKAINKLGMQINTSIITPNGAKKNINKLKKEASLLSKTKEDSESSDEDDSEEESEDNSEEEEESKLSQKSKMIDDEAGEASDDYESGDSRDEDEKKYEEQNAIVEKGETLDSDDEEYSDNSDYEKDSFVVDSDEEDNELLSGSGDDLSLSANELSMSAKSKQKFNERKIKEQKKASREMFESRHKLNESDKKNTSKKEQKLQQTLSTSDEDIHIRPKKNRRARIDSSHDASSIQSDKEKSITKKKKKVNRLSESTIEDENINEKEITMLDYKKSETADPLSLQNIVKLEPKTPEKGLNISTVAISNLEDIEQVQVDNNVSIRKMNETSDPLETTTAQNNASDDSDDKSISENEEITQNYESMLNNLNKSSTKVKKLDHSLNLNKKDKPKASEPIIDQLNLTQIKKPKNKKENKKVETNKPVNKKVIESIQDEGSSDSIDMKLLFNEDSTDCESKTSKIDNNVDDFIPLKRTPAKTNIQQGTDEGDDQTPSFFIDTTGTHDINTSLTNTSLKSSVKKNKQKNNISIVENAEAAGNSDEAPLEVSYQKNNKSKDNLNITPVADKADISIGKKQNQSGKKNKKNNKDSNSSQVNITINVDKDESANEPPLEVSYQKNKNNKSKENLNITPIAEGKADLSYEKKLKESKKKDKKNNSFIKITEDNETENLDKTETAVEKSINVSNTSLKGSNKKKKNNPDLLDELKTSDDTPAFNDETKSKKRKRQASRQSSDETSEKDDIKVLDVPKLLNNSVPQNEKKKRKINTKESADPQEEDKAVPEPKQGEEQEKLSGKRNKILNKPNEVNHDITKKNKRKERDDDDNEKLSKVIKQDVHDKAYVPRLPAKVLKELDDKPNKETQHKPKVVSTTSFKVEETRKRRNKPSNYLEESVYLNDSKEEENKKSLLKKPKVLPFIPTASTSGYGFTTTFRVNVLPQETKFVAQSSNTSNFKNDLLHKNRIKKLGTFEMYKRHRNIKISKF